MLNLNFMPQLALLLNFTKISLFVGIGYAGVVNVRYMAMAHESGVVGRGDGLFKWWFG